MTRPEKAIAPARTEERRAALSALDTGTLLDLIRVGQFNPARHFRHFPWRNFDFRGMNLRGFDFTGAVLDGARFDNALIGPGPDMNGHSARAALFDFTQLGAVLFDEALDPNLPAKVPRRQSTRRRGLG